MIVLTRKYRIRGRKTRPFRRPTGRLLRDITLTGPARDNGNHPLIVDTAEPDPKFRAMLLRGLGIPAETGHLETGDYVWDTPEGPAMIERKEVSDLCTSLLTHRLDEQLQRLVDLAYWPILLIEGQIEERDGCVWIANDRTINEKRIDYDRLENTLLAWQARGVLRRHSPNSGTTHIRIASAYFWSNKQRADYTPIIPRRRRLPNLGRLSERAEILAGIPGIGTKRAEALAAQAPLREILGNWDNAQFAQVTGSRKLADEILQILEEQP